MSKIATAYLAAVRLLATYPAISTALVSVGVVVAAFFGLHITGDQLIYVVGVVSALGAMIVHSNVVPLIKAAIPKVVTVKTVPAKSLLPATPPAPATIVAETRIDPVITNG